MTLDAKFFTGIKKTVFGGKLKQSQVDGINAIYTAAGAATNDRRWIAYMLATATWETASMMQPIAEYGKGKGRKYGVMDAITRQTYYGRGYVQLTWHYNYLKMGEILGLDLVNNPDLAMRPDVAADIMVIGMTRGTFTGRKLEDYFNKTKCDWINARRIINGTDKAREIAAIAEKYFALI